MSALRRFVLSFLVVGMATIGLTDARAAQPVFNLRIELGRVPENMRLIRVEQRDAVTLRWSVDRPMTLHLHGYDIEKQVTPGTVGEMTFTARATGRFPIHIHGTGAGTGKLAPEEAPLVNVEVYPR